MITLVAVEDQLEFVTSIRDYFAKRLSIHRVRELSQTEDGVGDALWQEYSDMGWLAMGAPEEMGGVGLTVIEEALLMIEAGRYLAPGPLRSTLLAVRIAVDAGDEALVERLISGQVRAGVVVGDSAVDVRVGDLMIRLGESTTELAEVLELEPLAAVDPNTRIARITSSRTVLETDRSYLSNAKLLAAAELLGVLEAIRDESAAYARLRQQFGKQIGSFQAVKHRCADMAIAAYAVRAQVSFAAVHLEAGAPDAALQVDMALALATEKARDSATANILNHGGIGFTWEANPHLYLKRATMLGRLYGTERQNLARVFAASPAS